MIDQVINEILDLRYLILGSIIFVCIAFIAFIILTREFKWDDFTVEMFGIFYNLSSEQCVSLGIAVTRFIYVLIFVIFNDRVSVEYLFPIVLMSIIIDFVNRNYINIFNSCFYSVDVYVLIYLVYTLSNYYDNVDNNVIVLIMYVILIVFVIIFNIYWFLKTYGIIILLNEETKTIKQNKLVKLISQYDLKQTFRNILYLINGGKVRKVYVKDQRRRIK